MNNVLTFRLSAGVNAMIRSCPVHWKLAHARQTQALIAWGTPDFESVLKKEIQQRGAEHLPLQQGLSTGSHVLDNKLQAMVIRVSDDAGLIGAKAGIFYTGILIGCSFADDPTPVNEESEYCVVGLDISKSMAETTVALSGGIKKFRPVIGLPVTGRLRPRLCENSRVARCGGNATPVSLNGAQCAVTAFHARRLRNGYVENSNCAPTFSHTLDPKQTFAPVPRAPPWPCAGPPGGYPRLACRRAPPRGRPPQLSSHG